MLDIRKISTFSLVRHFTHTASLVTVLYLAGCATQTPPLEEETPGTSASSRPTTYTVVRGDTLGGIAKRYGLDYRELATWNSIVPPYTIQKGQELRLYPPGSEPGNMPPPRLTRPAGTDVEQFGTGRWAWPTRGSVVQTFQAGDRTRTGIRIAGTPGQSITAAESGKVIYSGSGLPGYGPLVILKHAGNYLTAYGFNRKLLVQDGDEVTRGQPIAEMGIANDGQALLHFEVRQGERVLDPLQFLARP